MATVCNELILTNLWWNELNLRLLLVKLYDNIARMTKQATLRKKIAPWLIRKVTKLITCHYICRKFIKSINTTQKSEPEN
jgi:hypothetical protein